MLRVKKAEEKQFTDSLEKEYVFLNYFKTNGIEFCPEVVYFDAEHNFLIETFLPGKNVSQADFSLEQIDRFVSQLHQLFNLDVLQFDSYCTENNFKKFRYQSPVESLELYGFERFEEIDSAVVGSDVVNWISDKLNENLQYVQGIDVQTEKLGFSWGDIQSKVIVDAAGDMFFYDFEHANIANSFGLPYIKIHGSFTEKQFSYLLQRCTHYFGKSESELIDEINKTEKIVRVNDVIWAAMMWSTERTEAFAKETSRRMNRAAVLY